MLDEQRLRVIQTRRVRQDSRTQFENPDYCAVSEAIQVLEHAGLLPVHYGFGIPGVNAPGIPGVTCNAGAGGPGLGRTGRPGISGASVGRSSGGSPSVARTGSLVNPLGFM